MEKTAYEIGYLSALESLGISAPSDPMTKEAQGRFRGFIQAAKGIVGGQGRQVAMPKPGKPGGPGLLQRGWERLTQGRRVTLPPPPVPGATGAARGAARGASPGARQVAAKPTADVLPDAPAKPGFLRRHAGKAALTGTALAGGAYGMHQFDQYARRPAPGQPQQYYSAIPGGSPYGGY